MILAKQKKALMEKKQFSKLPTLQDIKTDMESCDGYEDVFLEIFKLLNILIVIPVGTATVKLSFGQIKHVKKK